MTLLECLNEFNDDEELIDLTAKRIPKKVSEIKKAYRNDVGNYWIAEHLLNYGKNIKKSITCKFGSVFIQK